MMLTTLKNVFLVHVTHRDCADVGVGLDLELLAVARAGLFHLGLCQRLLVAEDGIKVEFVLCLDDAVAGDQSQGDDDVTDELHVGPFCFWLGYFGFAISFNTDGIMVRAS
jgi:hypothetical protein